MVIYVAGISVKVGAHYPGRSYGMPCVLPSSRGDGMCHKKSAEVILAQTTMSEGPNHLLRTEPFVKDKGFCCASD